MEYYSPMGFLNNLTYKREKYKIGIMIPTTSRNRKWTDIKNSYLYKSRGNNSQEITMKNTTISSAEIWLGRKSTVDLYVDKDIYKTIPKGRKKHLKVVANYEGPIEAPIMKGQEVGNLNIYYKDELLDQHILYAKEDVKRLNMISRILRSINFLIWGDV